MGSDRTRISYNEQRQYRAVVMQQGRVTVEADWNEAQQIVGEEVRQEALDFVGPSGVTPIDAYAIEAMDPRRTDAFDFLVHPGTIYVGGLRVHLNSPIQYNSQQEWLDHSTDPDWIELSTVADREVRRELIYLSLREQEVSAVEDSALREVALGGPDTAQRTRLIQHIVRLSTNVQDCSSALAVDAAAKWETEGLYFESETQQLKSWGTLKASFQEPTTPPDLCEPQAQGGYLGADNQLIRVQISAPNKFIWGFDNASFLYRVDVVDAQTLHLRSRPVDAFHQPRANQVVEVLRSAALLDNGDYVASATGIVTKLNIPYDPDTQNITLPVSLPQDYLDTNQTPQLFLRVWEEELPFTPGTTVSLGNTGLHVTLQTNPVGKPFHIGDYWLLAVRPSTPTEVYPQRYLVNFQSPDGPRLWACSLAVINWIPSDFGLLLELLEDCRNPFDNLVELTKRKLGGCCTVSISPEDITANKTLQNILDQYKGVGNTPQPMTVCFMPGTYSLIAPLRLGPEHSNITLEGCHNGVIFQAAANADINQFLDGLVVLTQVEDVVLRRLQFELPLVPFVTAVSKLGSINPSLLEYLTTGLPNVRAAIGLRMVNSANITIQDCIFQALLSPELDVFGMGIFAVGECNGLTVRGNHFVREEVTSPPQQPPIITSTPVEKKVDTVATSPNLREEVETAATGNLLSLFNIAASGTNIAMPETPPGTSSLEAGKATVAPLPNLLDIFNISVGSAITDAAAVAPGATSSGVIEQSTSAVTEVTPSFNNLLAARQPVRILFGYLLLPFGTLTPADRGQTPETTSRPTAKVMRSLLQNASFQNNQFSGLTFAALIIADIGIVKFEDNAVRDCLAGFWLESLSFWGLNLQTSLTSLSQATSQTPLSLGALQVLFAFLLEPVTVFGVELALFYPLPQGFTPNQDSLVGVELTSTSSGASTSTQRSLLEIQPFLKSAHKSGFSISLYFLNNAIDAFLTDSILSSIGLLSLGDIIQQGEITISNGEMIMNANKIRNQTANAPTCAIIAISHCSVTGNLILNETTSAAKTTAPSITTAPSTTTAPGTTTAPSTTTTPSTTQTTPLSLVLIPGSSGRNGFNGIAVTGNVLQGQSTLSSLTRPFAAPLDTWLFANAQI